MTGKRIILGFFALVLLGGGVVYWKLAAEPPAPNDDTPEFKPPPAGDPKKASTVETEEEKSRRMVLGIWHWQDDYKNKPSRVMTLTLNQDGTGTMQVELSGFQAFLTGPKLRFDMRWGLKDKILKKQTIGGEPSDKVNMILNTMGNTAEDTILDLTENRLFLVEKDGKTKYDWQRAPAAP